MTFTVVKQGQQIEFESAFGQLETAKYYLNEHLSYNNFAMNLVSRKNLSEKQIAWIHYLATENLTQDLEKETQEPGQYSSLVKKMYDAVKSPNRKFTVRLPGVTIATVTKGANQGALYLYENNSYVGKITQNGDLKANITEDTKNLLEDANENLLQLAKIYGHETGECSICGRTLSDPLSIQMGIGPVCAKRLS